MLTDLFREKSFDDSQAYYRARRAYQNDPTQDFVRVKNRIGLAAAGVYAQIYFANQTRYKRFRRELDLHQSVTNHANKDFDVLIVAPPRGSLRADVIQRFVRQSMGLATSAGFSYVSQAQLNTDRVLHGARRLYNLVREKKKAGRQLLIVSHSFGSAFVRVMFDQVDKNERNHIKGWMNISGLIFGTPLFDCSDKKSFFNKTSAWQRTFSCEQRYFHGQPQTQGVKTLHFLGMKNDQTLTRAELKQRQHLKAWGPNDGLLTYSPYQHLDQTVVPLFDQGHLVDLSQMSMTFVRSLSAMVSTLPQNSIQSGQQLAHHDFL